MGRYILLFYYFCKEQLTKSNIDKMMKKIFTLLAAVAMVSCGAPKLELLVENNSTVNRDLETIEIQWEDVAKSGITPEEVTVFCTECNKEIPSQVIYNGEVEPQSLIFQCSVEAGASKKFVVKKGTPEAYEMKCYGRQVPERHDDYAWENNKIAFRAYGVALESVPGEMLSSPGFDCWVKCVDTLVVDARYKRGNYHHNYGDGMDCYKVGRTLGAGASAPYVDEQLWLSGNYVTYKTLDKGALRTSVELTYAPFKVKESEVTLKKIITLDANTHFNRIENIYEGEFETMPVAAGFIRHDVKALNASEGWLAFVEAASDSKHPEEDGDIYFAVVLPGAEFRAETAGHAVAIAEVESGVSMVYYAGAGWSLGGVEDMPAWMELTEKTYAMVNEPLVVTIL